MISLICGIEMVIISQYIQIANDYVVHNIMLYVSYTSIKTFSFLLSFFFFFFWLRRVLVTTHGILGMRDFIVTACCLLVFLSICGVRVFSLQLRSAGSRACELCSLWHAGSLFEACELSSWGTQA